MRLAVGAFWGIALGIPLGLLIGMSQRAHTALWPVLLFFQAIGDIAWLPILVIWFGYGLVTMTFVIVYTVHLPRGAQHRARRALHSRQYAPCRAEPRRIAIARTVGGRAAGRACPTS